MKLTITRALVLAGVLAASRAAAAVDVEGLDLVPQASGLASPVAIGHAGVAGVAGEDAAGELYLAAGDSRYRLTGPGGGGGGGDCPLPPGNPRYCDECGPCDEGEGGCRGDDQCRDSLVCAENFGALFGLPRTVDVCVTPGGVPRPAFTARELPAAGDLTVIWASALNNAGQVVGEGAGSEDRDLRSVGFRFSPATGLEVLDPRGDQRSQAYLINEAGDVFGALLSADRLHQTGVFLYRDGSGFDPLTRGSSGLIRRTFGAVGLNEAGDVLGRVYRNGLRVAYLYVAGDGWHDLSALDPRLRTGSTDPWALNDAGDVVLTVARYGKPELRAFLVRRGEVVALGDLGGGWTLPRALNDSGRAVGYSLLNPTSPHAFVTTGPGRLLDIHPPRFAASYAQGVTAKGIVSGVIDSEHRGVSDALFTWDPRRFPKLRLQARRSDFNALLSAQGSTIRHVGGGIVNERLEFFGAMLFDDPLGEVRTGVYLFSPPHGLAYVQDLAASAGVAGTVGAPIDLNDWGALLMSLTDGRVVVLTPAM